MMRCAKVQRTDDTETPECFCTAKLPSSGGGWAKRRAVQQLTPGPLFRCIIPTRRPLCSVFT